MDGTSWLLVAVGCAILLFVWADVAWTALTLDGGGPLTRVILKAPGGLGGPPALTRMPWLRSKVGALVVLANAMAWIVLMWVGWTLVFSASERSIIHAETQAAADLLERVYFVGSTLSTLGIGDFAPQGGGWRVLTFVSASTGFVAITLAISYFIPVLSAVMAQRQLAMMMTSLGKSPPQIVALGWHDEQGVQRLVERIQQFSQRLMQIDQLHAAYPVLHHFVPRRRHASLAVGLACMHECLLIMEHGLASSAKPDAFELRPIHFAIEVYLRQLSAAGITPTTQVPPLPALGELEENGVPVIAQAEFARHASAADARRRMLAAYAEVHGWTWDDVHEAG